MQNRPNGLGYVIQGESDIPLALLQELNGGKNPWLVPVLYPSVDVKTLLINYSACEMAPVCASMSDCVNKGQYFNYPLLLNEPDQLNQGNTAPDVYAAMQSAIWGKGHQCFGPNVSSFNAPWLGEYNKLITGKHVRVMHGYGLASGFKTLASMFAAAPNFFFVTELFPQDLLGKEIPLLSPKWTQTQIDQWHKQIADFVVMVYKSNLPCAIFQIPYDGLGTPYLATKHSGKWELSPAGKLVAKALSPVVVTPVNPVPINPTPPVAN
jgi:hypothetical protein